MASQSPQPPALDLDDDVTGVHVSASGNMSFEVPVNGMGDMSSTGASPAGPHQHSPFIKKPTVNSPRRELTAKDIEKKLKAAEERREEAVQASREKAIAEAEKIEEANRRRESQEQAFKQNAEKMLEQKLEANKENREKALADLTEKAKREDEKTKQAREIRETRMSELMNDIQQRIEHKQFKADELRVQKTEELVERLQKEIDHVAAVRQILAQASLEDDEQPKWQKKLEEAQTRRDQLQNAIKERQAVRNQHVAEIRDARKAAGSDQPFKQQQETVEQPSSDKKCNLQ